MNETTVFAGYGADNADGVGPREDQPQDPYRSGFPATVGLGARAYAQGLDDGLARRPKLTRTQVVPLLVAAINCDTPEKPVQVILHEIYAGAWKLGRTMPQLKEK